MDSFKEEKPSISIDSNITLCEENASESNKTAHNVFSEDNNSLDIKITSPFEENNSNKDDIDTTSVKNDELVTPLIELVNTVSEKISMEVGNSAVLKEDLIHCIDGDILQHNMDERQHVKMLDLGITSPFEESTNNMDDFDITNVKNDITPPMELDNTLNEESNQAMEVDNTPLFKDDIRSDPTEQVTEYQEEFCTTKELAGPTSYSEENINNSLKPNINFTETINQLVDLVIKLNETSNSEENVSLSSKLNKISPLENISETLKEEGTCLPETMLNNPLTQGSSIKETSNQVEIDASSRLEQCDNHFANLNTTCLEKSINQSVNEERINHPFKLEFDIYKKENNQTMEVDDTLHRKEYITNPLEHFIEHIEEYLQEPVSAEARSRTKESVSYSVEPDIDLKGKLNQHVKLEDACDLEKNINHPSEANKICPEENTGEVLKEDVICFPEVNNCVTQDSYLKENSNQAVTSSASCSLEEISCQPAELSTVCFQDDVSQCVKMDVHNLCKATVDCPKLNSNLKESNNEIIEVEDPSLWRKCFTQGIEHGGDNIKQHLIVEGVCHSKNDVNQSVNLNVAFKEKPSEPVKIDDSSHPKDNKNCLLKLDKICPENPFDLGSTFQESRSRDVQMDVTYSSEEIHSSSAEQDTACHEGKTYQPASENNSSVFKEKVNHPFEQDTTLKVNISQPEKVDDKYMKTDVSYPTDSDLSCPKENIFQPIKVEVVCFSEEKINHPIESDTLTENTNESMDVDNTFEVNTVPCEENSKQSLSEDVTSVCVENVSQPEYTTSFSEKNINPLTIPTNNTQGEEIVSSCACSKTPPFSDLVYKPSTKTDQSHKENPACSEHTSETEDDYSSNKQSELLIKIAPSPNERNKALVSDLCSEDHRDSEMEYSVSLKKGNTNKNEEVDILSISLPPEIKGKEDASDCDLFVLQKINDPVWAERLPPPPGCESPNYLASFFENKITTIEEECLTKTVKDKCLSPAVEKGCLTPTVKGKCLSPVVEKGCLTPTEEKHLILIKQGKIEGGFEKAFKIPNLTEYARKHILKKGVFGGEIKQISGACVWPGRHPEIELNSKRTLYLHVIGFNEQSVSRAVRHIIKLKKEAPGREQTFKQQKALKVQQLSKTEKHCKIKNVSAAKWKYFLEKCVFGGRIFNMTGAYVWPKGSPTLEPTKSISTLLLYILADSQESLKKALEYIRTMKNEPENYRDSLKIERLSGNDFERRYEIMNVPNAVSKYILEKEDFKGGISEFSGAQIWINEYAAPKFYYTKKLLDIRIAGPTKQSVKSAVTYIEKLKSEAEKEEKRKESLSKFEREYDISNLTKFAQQYIIEKGVKGGGIKEFSGACVLPKEYPEDELHSAENEKSLCLSIKGPCQQSIDLAIKYIEKLKEEVADDMEKKESPSNLEREYEVKIINITEFARQYIIEKGVKCGGIKELSGACVLPREYPEDELHSAENEKSLCLNIKASSRQSVELAVKYIEKLIEEVSDDVESSKARIEILNAVEREYVIKHPPAAKKKYIFENGLLGCGITEFKAEDKDIEKLKNEAEEEEGKKSQNNFESEYVVRNLTEFTRQYIIEKGVKAGGIKEVSGACVLPREYPEDELHSAENEKSLCLYIKASSQQSLELAVKYIDKLKEEVADGVEPTKRRIDTSNNFEREYEIKNLPAVARKYILEKGVISGGIEKYSGACVWPREYPERELHSAENERPLYLYIKGSNQQSVELAIKYIEKLQKEGADYVEPPKRGFGTPISIEREYEIKNLPAATRKYILEKGVIGEEIKKYSSATVWPREYPAHELNSADNERPLCLYIKGTSQYSVYMAIKYIEKLKNEAPAEICMMTVEEKVPVGLESAESEFDLVTKVLGVNGGNLKYIKRETGALVTLCGVKIGRIVQSTGIQPKEPLYIHVQHTNRVALQRAAKLASDLVKSVHQEYTQFAAQLNQLVSWLKQIHPHAKQLMQRPEQLIQSPKELMKPPKLIVPPPQQVIITPGQVISPDQVITPNQVIVPPQHAITSPQQAIIPPTPMIVPPPALPVAPVSPHIETTHEVQIPQTTSFWLQKLQNQPACEVDSQSTSTPRFVPANTMYEAPPYFLQQPPTHSSSHPNDQLTALLNHAPGNSLYQTVPPPRTMYEAPSQYVQQPPTHSSTHPNIHNDQLTASFNHVPDNSLHPTTPPPRIVYEAPPQKAQPTPPTVEAAPSKLSQPVNSLRSVTAMPQEAPRTFSQKRPLVTENKESCSNPKKEAFYVKLNKHTIKTSNMTQGIKWSWLKKESQKKMSEAASSKGENKGETKLTNIFAKKSRWGEKPSLGNVQETLNDPKEAVPSKEDKRNKRSTDKSSNEYAEERDDKRTSLERSQKVKQTCIDPKEAVPSKEEKRNKRSTENSSNDYAEKRENKRSSLEKTKEVKKSSKNQTEANPSKKVKRGESSGRKSPQASEKGKSARPWRLHQKESIKVLSSSSKDASSSKRDKRDEQSSTKVSHSSKNERGTHHQQLNITEKTQVNKTIKEPKTCHSSLMSASEILPKAADIAHVNNKQLTVVLQLLLKVLKMQITIMSPGLQKNQLTHIMQLLEQALPVKPDSLVTEEKRIQLLTVITLFEKVLQTMSDTQMVQQHVKILKKILQKPPVLAALEKRRQQLHSVPAPSTVKQPLQTIEQPLISSQDSVKTALPSSRLVRALQLLQNALQIYTDKMVMSQQKEQLSQITQMLGCIIPKQTENVLIDKWHSQISTAMQLLKKALLIQTAGEHPTQLLQIIQMIQQTLKAQPSTTMNLCQQKNQVQTLPVPVNTQTNTMQQTLPNIYQQQNQVQSEASLVNTLTSSRQQTLLTKYQQQNQVQTLPSASMPMKMDQHASQLTLMMKLLQTALQTLDNSIGIGYAKTNLNLIREMLKQVQIKDGTIEPNQIVHLIQVLQLLEQALHLEDVIAASVQQPTHVVKIIELIRELLENHSASTSTQNESAFHPLRVSGSTQQSQVPQMTELLQRYVQSNVQLSPPTQHLRNSQSPSIITRQT